MIFVPDDLENAVMEELRAWMPSTLYEISIERDEELLQSPLSYNIRPDNNQFVEDQLPALIIVSPGTLNNPRKSGDQVYEADYRILIVAIISSTGRVNVNRNARIYAAAIRAVLVRRPGLGGIAMGGLWEGESFDEGPEEQGRSLASITVEFAYTVPNVVQRGGGPATPLVPPQPIPDGPEVTSTDLTVDKKD